MALSDRYVLGKSLGSGAAGEVFLATRRKDDRKVAIKFLQGQEAIPQGRERFVEEVRTLARLRSPFVIRIVDAGIHEMRPYYVMEYVSGRDLAETVAQRGKFELRVSLHLTGQIASALGTIHEAGIIHRDLKPSNVMLTREGRAKLADFGLAKGTASRVRTRSGMLLGTPGYLAPEILQGGKATPAVDLYALGLILYFMRVGQPVFRETNLADQVQAQLRGPTEHDLQQLDPELRPLFLSLVTADPGERPGPAAVVERCKALLQGLGTESTPPPGEIRTALTPAVPPLAGSSAATVPQAAVSSELVSSPPASSPPRPGASAATVPQPALTPAGEPASPTALLGTASTEEFSSPEEDGEPGKGAPGEHTQLSVGPGLPEGTLPAAPEPRSAPPSPRRSPLLYLPLLLCILVLGWALFPRSAPPLPPAIPAGVPEAASEDLDLRKLLREAGRLDLGTVYGWILEEPWAESVRVRARREAASSGGPGNEGPTGRDPEDAPIEKLIEDTDRNLYPKRSMLNAAPGYFDSWPPRCREITRKRLVERTWMPALRELLEGADAEFWSQLAPGDRRNLARVLLRLNRVNHLDSLLGGPGNLIPGLEEALAPVVRWRLLSDRPGATWQAFPEGRPLLERCHLLTAAGGRSRVATEFLTEAAPLFGQVKYCAPQEGHNQVQVRVPLEAPGPDGWIRVVVGIHDLFHNGLVQVALAEAGPRKLLQVDYHNRRGPMTHVVHELSAAWDAYPLEVAFHESLLGRPPHSLLIQQEDMLGALKRRLPEGHPCIIDTWFLMAGVSQLGPP